MPAWAATLTTLTVELGAVRSDEGRIYVAVFPESASKTFPDAGDAIAGAWRIASAGSRRFVFAELPPGRYAVTAYHDENGNGELDANMLGIPTEGYGFANDAFGRMGPPSFGAAAVEVGEDGGTADISLSY
ncbi:MAG: DUF2141 domain-containing protein [Gammaproteobacteria bacterium]|nr:DUF2141 domain-containing protein [Gammaproteobacteria bacterium]MYB36019.1 DUF2141 domain-containing protein [Gammaproteobacteria bacterium]